MKKYIFAVILLTLALAGAYTLYTNRAGNNTNSQTNTTNIDTTNQVQNVIENREVSAPSATSTKEQVPEKVRLATADTVTNSAAITMVAKTAVPATVPTIAATSFTLADVQKHASEQSCYSAINGNVYDLTSWINKHPGGKMAIMFICGKDGTNGFMGKHAQSEKAQAALAKYKIGTLAQ